MLHCVWYNHLPSVQSNFHFFSATDSMSFYMAEILSMLAIWWKWQGVETLTTHPHNDLWSESCNDISVVIHQECAIMRPSSSINRSNSLHYHQNKRNNHRDHLQASISFWRTSSCIQNSFHLFILRPVKLLLTQQRQWALLIFPLLEFSNLVNCESKDVMQLSNNQIIKIIVIIIHCL